MDPRVRSAGSCGVTRIPPRRDCTIQLLLRKDRVNGAQRAVCRSRVGVRTVMPESSVLFDASRGDIDVREIPGGVGVVVALRGDHDLSTKPRVVEALSRLRRESAVIVIDLRQCTFVDSTIIAVILDAGCRDAPQEPHVSVVLPDDASYVCRALSVIGLRDLLPVRLSVEAALEAGSRDCDAGTGHEFPR